MSQIAPTGAPTPRRSARLSQAGSVTGQSVLTNVTTGGTRQRKKGPLTKVKPRKSNAYGASGRVGAAEEISVSATGFAQAFQNQRGDAVARDDEESDVDDMDELGAETPRMGSSINSHAAGRSPLIDQRPDSRLGPGLSFLNSEAVAPSDDGFDLSIGNTSKSFGLGHEAGMLPQSMRQQSSRASSEAVTGLPLWQKNMSRRTQLRAQGISHLQDEADAGSSPNQQDLQASQLHASVVNSIAKDVALPDQAPLQRARSPKPRDHATTEQQHPKSVAEWLGTVQPDHVDESEWPWKRIITWAFWGLITMTLLVLILPTSSSPHTQNPSSRMGIASALNARISQSKADLASWIMPDGGNTYKQKLDSDIKFGANTDNSQALWLRMQQLYDSLDDRIGDMHTTITGLSDELPEFVVVRQLPDGRREITEKFWSALMDKVKSSSNDAVWAEFLEDNKDKLRKILGVTLSTNENDTRPVAVSRQEFMDMIRDQYNSISAQLDQKIYDTIKGQASQIKAIAQTEARKAMIESIRLQSLAQSNLLANYEINLRKPNYFSPGFGALIEPSLTSATYLDNPTLLSKFSRRMALISPRNPPKAALSKWEEPGDCWCSAPAPPLNGQAQLTVVMSRPVFPNQITIEHLPMEMAPAKKITNAPRHIELWVETDQPVRHRFENHKHMCKDGPAGWTCLGAFKYNVHASNHVQTFDLDAASSVPITKAMVRVLSNWGADHTCLYRVRLHGEDGEEDYKYNVVLQDPAV